MKRELAGLPFTLRHRRVMELIDEALDNVKSTQSLILREGALSHEEGAEEDVSLRAAVGRLRSLRLPLLGSPVPWKGVSSSKSRRSHIMGLKGWKKHKDDDFAPSRNQSLPKESKSEASLKCYSPKYNFSRTKDFSKQIKHTESVSKSTAMNKETFRVNYPNENFKRADEGIGEYYDKPPHGVERERILRRVRKDEPPNRAKLLEKRNTVSRFSSCLDGIQTETRYSWDRSRDDMAKAGSVTAPTHAPERKRLPTPCSPPSQAKNVKFWERNATRMIRNPLIFSSKNNDQSTDEGERTFSESGRSQTGAGGVGHSSSATRLPSLTRTRVGGSLRIDSVIEALDEVASAMDGKGHVVNGETSTGVRLPPIAPPGLGTPFDFDDSGSSGSETRSSFHRKYSHQVL